MYLPVPSDPEAKDQFWRKIESYGYADHKKPDWCTKNKSITWIRFYDPRSNWKLKWSAELALNDVVEPSTVHPLIKGMFDIVQDAGIVGNTLMQDEELLDSIIQSYMEKLKHERI